MEVTVVRKIGTDVFGIHFWGMGWYVYLRRERGKGWVGQGGPYASAGIARDYINALAPLPGAGEVKAVG